MLANMIDCEICGLYHPQGEPCKDAVGRLEKKLKEVETDRDFCQKKAEGLLGIFHEERRAKR